MCTSREEIENSDSSLSYSPNISVQHKCMKCDETAVTIARTKDPFCRTCFSTYFMQKFRTILGKSRLLKHGEMVLLSFSGGPSSRVLLKLIEDALSEQSSKKIPIIPSVLFINEGPLLGQSKVEQRQTIIKILSIAEKTGFPTFFIPLEQIFGETFKPINVKDIQGVTNCFDDDRLQSILLQSEETLQTQLLTSFEKVTSLTAKENFLLTMRHRLLVEVAKTNGYSKVFLGDNADRVSIRLLGNISQGRGSSLPLDTGFFDDRNSGVMFIRPLRNFLHCEVLEFISINNLSTVNTSTLQSINKGVSSIESITETFVNGLQANFPSTVNTVFRTGDKLGVHTDEMESDLTCDLCKVPLVQVKDEYIFNHLSKENTSLFLRRLCYGCRLTMKDMEETQAGVEVPLPLAVGKETTKKEQ